MAEHGVGSIVVTDAGGRPIGIVTDRDLRGRVLAAGRPPETPVASVMSAPLVTVSPEAFVLEALLAMTRGAIHHLPVVEDDRLVGVVSSHDLFLLQAATPLELVRLIRSRASVDELARAVPDLTAAVRTLFEQGLSGYELGRIVAELNDQVIGRVLELVGQELRGTSLDEPPVGFCWLVLGSEGRREQTIRTDQDNALVYDDAPPLLRGPAERYFEAFAGRVIQALIRLGYPECPGGSMASNPRWRQPLAVWREYFGSWVRETTPQHLMYASIYLDFRPVAGDGRLAEALRQEVRSQVAAWRSFPRYLGKLAVSHAPPLGLFGRFKVRWEEGGRGVNVKLGGLLLVANALRAYAMELGLAETNTMERLEAARRHGCFSPGEAEDVRQAWETLFHLRLRHQLECLAAGRRPDNLVDPSALGRADQQRLREAFRAVRRLQGKVEDRYLTQML